MMTTVLGQASVPEGTRVYAIGDVHGCLDELLALNEIIRAELARSPVGHPVKIFLGDYVDRGPKARQVVDELCRQLDGPDDVHCLLGNHDERLRNFLKCPREFGQEFLQYEGATTLSSFGIATDEEDGITPCAYTQLAGELARRMSERQHRFFDELELSVTIGDYHFVHAGVRPQSDLFSQTDTDQINIREGFLDYQHPLEKVVVHGHTMCDEPEVRQNRINVDTKAVLSGTLTCVVLEGKTHRFIST